MVETVFNAMTILVKQGWMRAIDLHFVRFCHQQCPNLSPSALRLIGWLSHQAGRGHLCLPLSALQSHNSKQLLALPPSICTDDEEANSEHQQSLQALNTLLEITPEAWQRHFCETGIATSGAGDTPLVVSLSAGGDELYLYLRRYWLAEQRIASRLVELASRQCEEDVSLPARLEQLFPEREQGDIHWQTVGAALATRSQLTLISGGPGTGKTTTVVRLLVLLQQQAEMKGERLIIRLAAPTGKAAARLTESVRGAIERTPGADQLTQPIPSEAGTLHRLLGSRPGSRQFKHHAGHPLQLDLLIVDEVSMVDAEMMACLLDALPNHARLILLGDKDQLASVEAGSLLAELCREAEQGYYSDSAAAWIKEQTGYDLSDYQQANPPHPLYDQIVLLRKSHRFAADSAIGQLARAVNQGASGEVRRILSSEFADLQTLPNSEDALKKLVLHGFKEEQGEGYQAYLKLVNSPPTEAEQYQGWALAVLAAFDRFRLLAVTRKGHWGVEGLNQRCARILFNEGLITAVNGWYSGRPVMVTRNNYALGLMNGDIGIALMMPDDEGASQQLKVLFPASQPNQLIEVLPSRLNEVDTVYAMTVHKSQGSEFLHTALVLPNHDSPLLTRELVYTGITRARERLTLMQATQQQMIRACERKTQRGSALAEVLSAV